MRLYVLPLAGLLALCACRKDPASKDTKVDSKTSTSGAELRPKPPVDEGIDVPTEEDFEEAVANQITPESDLQKELDQLEQDIGK